MTSKTNRNVLIGDTHKDCSQSRNVLTDPQNDLSLVIIYINNTGCQVWIPRRHGDYVNWSVMIGAANPDCRAQLFEHKIFLSKDY